MPLDPEVADLLERQKHLPPRSSLTVAETCAMRRRVGAPAGEPPPLPRVQDILLLAGSLAARQYWPTTEARQSIAVYFHKGRFFSGDLESHDTLCRLLALAAGCRIVAVDYRLAPEHRFPAAAEDACRAVRRAGWRARAMPAALGIARQALSEVAEFLRVRLGPQNRR